MNLTHSPILVSPREESPARAPVRMPDLSRVFLWAVMLIAGTVTVPQVVTFGGTSGGGMWTLVIVAATAVFWSMRPYLPREMSWVFLPLGLFTFFAVMSMSWGGIQPPSIQILSVHVAYFGLVMLTARECERDPALAGVLHKALDAASWTAAVAYTLTVAKFGQGGEVFVGDRPLFLARPFALFACIAVARQLARWHAGNRGALLLALWLTALVYLSQSRMALVILVLMYPLSFFVRGDRRNMLRGVLMGVAGVAALAAGILLYKPMYDRFFAYDASLSVGGVSVNASGRTVVWQLLLEDIEHDGWIVGHGIGTSSQRTDVINDKLGHPHNDFLRYLYDLGVVGLGMYLLFLAATLWALAKAVRRAAREHVAELPYYMTPLLALVGFMVAMCTDNPVTYIYLVAPLAVLIGAAMGQLGNQRQADAARAAAARARFDWEHWIPWQDERGGGGGAASAEGQADQANAHDSNGHASNGNGNGNGTNGHAPGGHAAGDAPAATRTPAWPGHAEVMN